MNIILYETNFVSLAYFINIRVCETHFVRFEYFTNIRVCDSKFVRCSYWKICILYVRIDFTIVWIICLPLRLAEFRILKELYRSVGLHWMIQKHCGVLRDTSSKLPLVESMEMQELYFNSSYLHKESHWEKINYCYWKKVQLFLLIFETKQHTARFIIITMCFKIYKFYFSSLLIKKMSLNVSHCC